MRVVRNGRNRRPDWTSDRGRTIRPRRDVTGTANDVRPVTGVTIDQTPTSSSSLATTDATAGISSEDEPDSRPWTRAPELQGEEAVLRGVAAEQGEERLGADQDGLRLAMDRQDETGAGVLQRLKDLGNIPVKFTTANEADGASEASPSSGPGLI